MTPIEEAQAVYRREWCERGFWDDVRDYTRYGYIISLPNIFILGRPVKSGWSSEMILDPANRTTEPDCWHIALYAGDLSKAFDFLPYYLPFVSFERRNRLKIYATSTLTGKLLSHDTVKI
jgi:hypothetical protein